MVLSVVSVNTSVRVGRAGMVFVVAFEAAEAEFALERDREAKLAQAERDLDATCPSMALKALMSRSPIWEARLLNNQPNQC